MFENIRVRAAGNGRWVVLTRNPAHAWHAPDRCSEFQREAEFPSEIAARTYARDLEMLAARDAAMSAPMTARQLRIIGNETVGAVAGMPRRLAAALGLNERTVRRWLNGQNEIPDWIGETIAEHSPAWAEIVARVVAVVE